MTLPTKKITWGFHLMSCVHEQLLGHRWGHHSYQNKLFYQFFHIYRVVIHIIEISWLTVQWLLLHQPGLEGPLLCIRTSEASVWVTMATWGSRQLGQTLFTFTVSSLHLEHKNTLLFFHLVMVVVITIMIVKYSCHKKGTNRVQNYSVKWAGT